MLTIFENHGAKLTVMAEIGQQWAHERVGESQGWATEITDAWESILKDVISRGFDVQLHLHPQRLNAKYIDGKWELDYTQWAISSLPTTTIREVVKEGKEHLERLLKVSDQGFECIAFRAGSYCIEPSEFVIEGLLASGMLCDSSVTKGMRDPRFYDYRDAESNILPWFASPREVKYQGLKSEGLLEIPICSFQELDIPLWRRFKDRKTTRELLRRYPSENRPILTNFPFDVEPAKSTILGSVTRQLSKVIRSRAVQLNYDQLGAKNFVDAVRGISSSAQLEPWEDQDVVIPIVATGHVKNIVDYDNIERLLEGLNKSLSDRAIHITLSDGVRGWMRQTAENPVKPDVS